MSEQVYVEDDLGAGLRLPARIDRIVSLVPSLTEAVAVSLPGRLVGATDYCTQPTDLDVTRVRGTKNPDLDTVVRLAPDLVIANEEENRPADLAALRARGLVVWVTAPRSVPAALTSLGQLLAACGAGQPSWLSAARDAWAPLRVDSQVTARAVVPIWRRPWMVLGRDTFAGDLLRRLGVVNLYADHAERYPRVTLPELADRGPDLVVLPDEPYAFHPDHDLDAFTGWSATAAFVSGRHLTWYGPSLADAPQVLRRQLSAGLPCPSSA